MKFFLDTANLDEIREAASLGVLDGVTTNPSLMAKEDGDDYHAVLKEICDIVGGPVSAEVVADESDEMIRQGRTFARLSEHIVVKVPMTPEGMKAVKTLSSDDIKTNVTLCFSANQGLIAAKAGATYISPFIGRLDDAGMDGMQVVADLVDIYERYAFTTQVLAASIRHPMHVVEAARLGADVSTMPYKIFQQLFKHPLTDVGIELFNRDWAKVMERRKANVRR
ncbi:MAG TPA: fructose-6-phosphate aldolase [Candidatus Krumholzibacteria bacterium]|nr:fructose-6-phosphate aldolase [Candidatus Krumholzibacteria bacterium]